MVSGDCNVCINSKMPSYSATCVECGLSRKNYKPMTNADRIRSMTDEELAEFIANAVDCCNCKHPRNGCSENDETCAACWLDWLRQEISEERRIPNE